VIYLLYAMLVLAIGIILLALKKEIISTVEDYFVSKSTRTKDRRAFEREIGCTWNATNGVDCRIRCEELYNSFGIGVAAGLIVLFALLLLGDVIAWRWLCCTWYDGQANLSKDTATPMTYSW
jgi:hypothetical protein